MYETSNDLASTTRRSAVEVLNEHLADAIDLQLQAKQAHWNIKGPNFVGLHELFDRVAAQSAEYSDLIAERAVALGGIARGTLQAVSEQSQLREYPLDVGDWRAHVRAMQDALATFGRGARKAIDDATALNDADTADLFTEISRGVDKSLWMVEAHVQDAPADTKQSEERSASRAAPRP
jgi:starvation-inducible DNA-binding protein